MCVLDGVENVAVTVTSSDGCSASVHPLLGGTRIRYVEKRNRHEMMKSTHRKTTQKHELPGFGSCRCCCMVLFGLISDKLTISLADRSAFCQNKGFPFQQTSAERRVEVACPENTHSAPRVLKIKTINEKSPKCFFLTSIPREDLSQLLL